MHGEGCALGQGTVGWLRAMRTLGQGRGLVNRGQPLAPPLRIPHRLHEGDRLCTPTEYTDHHRVGRAGREWWGTGLWG